MSTFLVVLAYLAAIGIPAALLYYLHAQAWYWHVLALAAALGMGFMPLPAIWDSALMNLAFGFVFTVLTIWGIGGLVLFHWHHHHGGQGHHRHA
jgi:hypothetical protein